MLTEVSSSVVSPSVTEATTPIIPAAPEKCKSEKPATNPMSASYRALRLLGLETTKTGGLRVVSFVAVAATSRRHLGKLAETCITGEAGDALRHIRVLEKSAGNGTNTKSDHLPGDCFATGKNPAGITVLEALGTLLGFASDATKARKAVVSAGMADLL